MTKTWPNDEQIVQRLQGMVNKAPMHLTQEEVTSVWQKMCHSRQIVEEAFERFNFNGGKDSVVMLNLIEWALQRHASSLADMNSGSNSSLSTFKTEHPLFVVFHILEQNTFQEMDQFLQDADTYYGFSTLMLDGKLGFKVALEQLVAQHPKIEAVFLGIRRSDPHGAMAHYFEKTTKGYPDMTRVNPILEWNYREIWAFLLAFQIPYCSLYDLGYTSLGRVDNTQKNPELKNDDTTIATPYLPAYLLKDGTKERESRIACSK